LRLQDPPHDIGRRVVLVEQRGRRHEPHRREGTCSSTATPLTLSLAFNILML
jgi:hypothetical protein